MLTYNDSHIQTKPEMIIEKYLISKGLYLTSLKRDMIKHKNPSMDTKNGVKPGPTPLSVNMPALKEEKIKIKLIIENKNNITFLIVKPILFANNIN